MSGTALLAAWDADPRLQDPLRHAVASAIARLPEASRLRPRAIFAALRTTPGVARSDLVLACFTLCQEPAALAAALATGLRADPSFARVEAVGAYLNITLTPSALIEEYLPDWRAPLLAGPRVTLEYSQPNTHKAFHIGHLRNVVLGNALSRLLASVGAQVVSANYYGDFGKHVAKVLWYLERQAAEPGSHTPAERLDEVYAKAAGELDDLEFQPQEFSRAQARISEILRRLREHGSREYALWAVTREQSLRDFRAVYASLGVSFDVEFYESDLEEPSVDYVHELEQRGLLTRSRGAIGCDLSAEGRGFCLLLKSDGNGLYATKDLFLAKLKNERFECDSHLYLVDVRQTRHLQQVFDVARRLGHERAALLHVPYEIVREGGAASASRRGGATSYWALRQRLLDLATRPAMRGTRETLAEASVKLGMLRMAPARKIDFCLDTWPKRQQRAASYVLYALARIDSLRAALGAGSRGAAPQSPDSLAPQERALMLLLSTWNDRRLRAARTLRADLLTSYALSLARCFHQFYASCRVDCVDASARQRRARLCADAGLVLSHALSLLGVTT